MSPSSSDDRSVILTADDAILSKYATVQAGYYDDPFLAPFAKSAVGLGGRKRVQPMIQHGTHARVACVYRAVATFLSLEEAAAQVVVLGAGLDSAFFRHQASSNHSIHWYELDHKSVIESKVRIVEASRDVFEGAEVVEASQHATISFQGGFLHLLAQDLRDKPSALIQNLVEAGLNLEQPTLIVSECVQMYLPQDVSVNLWNTLAEMLPKGLIVIYDALLKNNSNFGTVMEHHLNRANVIDGHSSLCRTRTLDQHLEKMIRESGGCHTAIACDMWTSLLSIVTEEERARAQKCCMLDEMEEFQLIMQHYCFVVASPTEWGKDYCGSQLGFNMSKSLTRKRDGESTV